MTNKSAFLCDCWNPGVQTFDAPNDVFLNTAMPTQATWRLPDPIDTVVRLGVNHDPDRRQAIVQRMRDAFENALRRVPID